mgnify:CR=1 FL=1|jgi:anti-anti-sigma factor
MSKIDRQDGKVIVQPEEDIVASMVDDFSKELKDLVENGETNLALDLQQVKMIDSMGLGALIATHNSLVKRNSQLEVQNVNEDILSLFKTMRLDHHFQIS